MVGSANSPFSEAFQPLQRKVIQAEQVTLDNLLKDVDILPNDLIKIDVEYYELSVLTGALNILKLKRPMLLVEIILSERLFYYKPEMRGKINELHAIEIESLLKHIGYFPYQILRDGVYRVDSVVNCPDTRDFLFSTSSGVERFIPIEKVAAYFSGE